MPTSPTVREELVRLLQVRALQVGQFTLASGKQSHYYVDGRKVTLAADGARLIGTAILEQLPEFGLVAAVGGLTMGADPIVGATLAVAAEQGRGALLGFLVRKTPKTHGTAQLIEGPIGAGMTVVILEDVTTTGSSALQAVAAAESMGCQVAGVITVLDRLEGAGAAFAARGLAFRALVTIRDLGVQPLTSA